MRLTYEAALNIRLALWRLRGVSVIVRVVTVWEIRWPTSDNLPPIHTTLFARHHTSFQKKCDVVNLRKKVPHFFPFLQFTPHLGLFSKEVWLTLHSFPKSGHRTSFENKCGVNLGRLSLVGHRKAGKLQITSKFSIAPRTEWTGALNNKSYVCA